MTTPEENLDGVVVKDGIEIVARSGQVVRNGVAVRKELEVRKMDTSQTKPSDIRIILKKLRKNEYYENIFKIARRLRCDVPPQVNSESVKQIRLMFAEIQKPFEKNKTNY